MLAHPNGSDGGGVPGRRAETSAEKTRHGERPKKAFPEVRANGPQKSLLVVWGSRQLFNLVPSQVFPYTELVAHMNGMTQPTESGFGVS